MNNDSSTAAFLLSLSIPHSSPLKETSVSSFTNQEKGSRKKTFLFRAAQLVSKWESCLNCHLGRGAHTLGPCPALHPPVALPTLRAMEAEPGGR